MLSSILFLTDKPLDGALGLIYFVCCCCCCCTSCVQLRALKLHKSVLPKDIDCSACLPPVHLSADAVAGIDPQYLMTVYQELHALARTATADCSMEHWIACLQPQIISSRYNPKKPNSNQMAAWPAVH